MISDSLIRRFGASAGVLFAACIFFGNGNLLGDSSSSDSASSLYKVLSDTQNISVGVFFTTIGALFAVGFALALRSVIAKGEMMPGGLSTVVLVAAATGAALAGIGPALMRGVTLRIDDATSTPAIAAFSHASAAALFFYASIFFAIEALAASAAALRGGTLPRWFGWLAMILGAAMIIGAAGAAFGSALAFIGSMALLSFPHRRLHRRVARGRPCISAIVHRSGGTDRSASMRAAARVLATGVAAAPRRTAAAAP